MANVLSIVVEMNMELICGDYIVNNYTDGCGVNLVLILWGMYCQ